MQLNESNTRNIDGLYAVVDMDFHYVFMIDYYEGCFDYIVKQTCIPRYIQRNEIGEFEYGNCKLVLVTKHNFPNAIDILSSIDAMILYKMCKPTYIYIDHIRSVIDDFNVWYDSFMKR